MIDFGSILRLVQELSPGQREALRALLDADKSSHDPSVTAPEPSRLLGLFAGSPDVIDDAMDSAYEQRSRPFRME